MKYNLLFIFLFCLSFGIKTRSQEIKVNRTFTEDTTLYIFDKNEAIAGIKINADIALKGKASLVRVILTTTDNEDLLVYESYPRLAENKTFMINSGADETGLLYNVKPACVKIQLINAGITIKSFLYSAFSGNLKFASFINSRDSLVKIKESDKMNRIKKMINKNNEKWVAGETDISRLSFRDKQAYFGNEKYNSQGLEYYLGGIFEFKSDNPKALNSISSINSSVVSQNTTLTTTLADHFDWRERHGATNPASPY